MRSKGKKADRPGPYSSLWEPHPRATRRHLPYGITHATSERTPPITSAMQAGTRFTYLGGMEG